MTTEHEHKVEHETTAHKKTKQQNTLILALAGVVLVILIFNQFQLSSLKNAFESGQVSVSTGTAGGTAAVATVNSVIPTGIPRIYGEELGVSYDDVTPSNPSLADKTITLLGNLDNSINLEGANLERYIKIVSMISCEYCCGAESIIFKDGQPACGCAHSYAMRGVAKYLISKHSTEFSDEEVLTELAKWKTLFFPGIMQTKAEALKQNGIEVTYINLGSNLYRGIEQGAQSSGGMVGGC